MIKLIQPKTGTVREVEESNHNKLRILERAGFILFSNYKPPKRKKVVPDPTVSDIVEKHKVEGVDPEAVLATETAIHVSGAARKLIEDNDLDPTLIEGTGKDGQITKPDVKKYLKALEEVEEPGELVTNEEEEGTPTDDTDGLKPPEALGEALEAFEEEEETE